MAIKKLVIDGDKLYRSLALDLRFNCFRGPEPWTNFGFSGPLNYVERLLLLIGQCPLIVSANQGHTIAFEGDRVSLTHGEIGC